MRVLIVEDDPEMLEALRRGFREEHFEVVTATNANEAIMAAVIETLAVIVLDVMLPGRNGFEICRELRRKGIATPILLLTARDAIDDRVTGLDSGADDYLVKPFAFDELLARVRALTRRQPVLVPDVHKVADLEVDIGTREVKRAGRPIELTGKEFELMECLLRHEGKVVDRATITGYVWDDNHDPFANAVEVLVRRLRAKIDDPFDQKLIHTVRAAGYRFGT
ncbi:MAG: response regulator transcription factor [Gemmatimonadota bacterium]|jgi:two-component system copper resistance phosphate regulon response regulator CusR